ncbi:hypothetical protein GQR58_020577 [Nymphon striatum]|nr:hypothetical protein GQR58_020577 [Nymphon striatum]
MYIATSDTVTRKHFLSNITDYFSDELLVLHIEGCESVVGFKASLEQFIKMAKKGSSDDDELPKNPPPLNKLPPTDDNLQFHVLRAYHQMLLWKEADQCDPSVEARNIANFDKVQMEHELLLATLSVLLFVAININNLVNGNVDDNTFQKSLRDLNLWIDRTQIGAYSEGLTSIRGISALNSIDLLAESFQPVGTPVLCSGTDSEQGPATLQMFYIYIEKLKEDSEFKLQKKLDFQIRGIHGRNAYEDASTLGRVKSKPENKFRNTDSKVAVLAESYASGISSK